VLSSLDLADLPARPAAVPDAGADPVSRLRRGDWLRLTASDRGDAYAKVAWINDSRTVLLLVRHPDRRAQSMRAVELAARFARGEAFLIQPTRDRPPES
jgi:16S rRNA U1498 N3-methylase RsmE